MSDVLEQYAVDRLRTTHLPQDYRYLPVTEYQCSRCDMTTTQVTEAFVHARLVHNDPEPKGTK